MSTPIVNYQQKKNEFSQRIPENVSLNIFSFLKPRDILSFAMTNKHLQKQLENEDFWEFICKEQFEPHHIEDVQNTLRKIKELKLILAEETYETIQQAIEDELFEWKFLYKKLSFMCRYISYESRVTDYDNPENWIIVNSEESEFGQYYQLENISWLHVEIDSPHVLPGNYDIIWRLKINSKNYKNLDNLEFSVEIVERVHELSTMGEYMDFAKEFVKPFVPGQKLISILKEKDDWVEYCLPVQAKFDPQEASIPGIPTTFHLRCKIFDYSDDVLKSGLSIDYVRLRHHDETENDMSNFLKTY
ncbi:12759_t:CDS:2 [Ambispora gerdemannii]|uniref:12759_t:CDS:1 n=1 Tax=Ambispora gerdemannii TaxID=144530 RepID=A0A9N8VTE7_9GLOM|nr:12759_t:CDS:2 [Ambispora gerdemannii]